MGRSLMILLMATFAVSMVSATEFHVTITGDDDDTGGALDPWRTIQYAASTAASGDTVVIHGGTYSGAVVFANDGTAQQPIVFRAATGETVIVDGTGTSLPDWAGLLTVSNRQHLVIDGLHLRNAGPNDENAGILIDESTHITIRNCTTYNTRSSGIGVWDSTDISVLDNRIELACNDGSQECLTVAGTDGFLVRGNEVFNGGPGSQGGEGIDVKDGSSNGLVEHNHVHDLNRLGIYVDSWDDHTHDIVVRNNVVHHNHASGMAVAAEAGGLLQDVWIYNNVVYGNRTTGITIAGWGEPVPSHPIDRIWIVHNTVVENGDTWGGGILFENTEATNVVVRNNLVSENLSFQIGDEGSGTGTVVDHNLIDGFRNDPSELWGSAPITGVPEFVSVAAGDFRIGPGSAARDSASATDAVTTDHGRGVRPLGTGFDVGAFEFGNLFSDDFEFGTASRWDSG